MVTAAAAATIPTAPKRTYFEACQRAGSGARTSVIVRGLAFAGTVEA
jgi:hypothetical protein